MNALTELRRQLAEAGSANWRPLPASAQIDQLIETLRQQGLRQRAPAVAPDAARQAVSAFRQTRRLTSLAQAQLVSYGLCLPYSTGAAVAGAAPAADAAPSAEATCLLEDTACFEALLHALCRWHDKPAAYRRCYQGLLHGYFGYDPGDPAAPQAGRSNWARLRQHLGQALQVRLRPAAAAFEPAWLGSLRDHPQLFTEAPGTPFAQAVLRGDFTAVEALCVRLGIGQASWFMRELVWAQVRAVEALPDDAFDSAVSAVLPCFEAQPLLRDSGLACLVNRDARRQPVNLQAGVREIPSAHPLLRDAAMARWGAPWLCANDVHWQAASMPARARLATAMGRVCIETFFGRWASDGPGSSRRAAFWLQYLPSIRQIHIVLGRRPAAEFERDGHLRWLARADGLALQAAEPDAAVLPALLLVLDGAVVVEFADGRVPMRSYPAAGAPAASDGAAGRMPIDLSQPLRTQPGAANSLQSDAAQLCLDHQDGQRGWRTWESWFEAALWQQYGVAPGAPGADGPGRRLIDLADPPGRLDDDSACAPPALPRGACILEPMRPVADQDVHWRTAEASIVPFSRADLAVFARIHGLRVDDHQSEGGKLWVRTGQADARIGLVLRRWGFAPVDRQGWWK